MNPASSDKPCVTVIVAAYNAARTLPRSLDSILGQTFTDFEVVLVDDGSCDETPQLVAAYAEKDPRLRVLRQDNQGVAVARQRGLDAARGEFTIHVDADDWVEPDMLESLVACAREKGADLVVCDYYEISGGTEKRRVQKPSAETAPALMGDLFYNLHGSLWNKLIRLSCIRDYDIRFIPGMNQCEDQYFCLRLLAHPVRVAYLDKACYHYDMSQNAQSLVNRGLSAQTRLTPLELIAAYTDISPVQQAYDRAVTLLAYQFFYAPKAFCPDYRAAFRKHLPSVRRAKGFPFHVKLLVWLKVVL